MAIGTLIKDLANLSDDFLYRQEGINYAPYVVRLMAMLGNPGNLPLVFCSECSTPKEDEDTRAFELAVWVR